MKDSDSDMSRREMLQLTGGSFAATAGCLGDGDSEVADFFGSSSQAARKPGGSLRVDHLFTPSRNADVVVWRDGDTIYADGQDGLLAEGSDFSTVMQTVLGSGDEPHRNGDASKVVIQEGTYTIDTDIEIPSRTIIQGMGSATKLVVNDGRGLWVNGSKGDTATLTSDAEVGDDTVSVSSTDPFNEGEYVLVNSDRTTEYRNQPYGEFQKVTRVDADRNRLVLEEGGLFDYYRTADDAKVTHMHLVENVDIRDLEIVGSDRSRYRSGVVTQYANGVHVENCEIHDLSHSAVRFTSTMNAKVEHCELYDVDYPNAGIGYGVDIINASRNISVCDNVLYDCGNHCTAVGGHADGFPRLLAFVGNDYYGDDADVHFGDKVFFKNNRFTNGSGGIITGAKSTWVESCTFKNISDHAIRHRGNPDDLYVTDSVFKNVQKRGIALYRNPNLYNRVVVYDNLFENIGSNVVRHRLRDGEQMDHFEFSGNVVSGCAANAVYLETVGDSSIKYACFNENFLQDIGGLAFGTGSIDTHVSIKDNTIHNVDNPYALIARGERAHVAGNSLANFSDRGLLLQSPALVTNNYFVDGGYDSVLVRDTSNVVAAFNGFANTNGADINGIDATNCKFLFNNLTTAVDANADVNVVESNFDV